MKDAKSIPFDQAAPYYDDTRKLADSVQQQILSLLAEELRGRGRALEIGVGTGRWALPLHQQGIPITGVDISLPMLRTLLEKAGGSAPFPLAVADATALPFKPEAFGAGFVCHVFHLISNWERSVVELVRVVRSGGVLLVDIGGSHGIRGDIKRHFAEAAGKPELSIGLTKMELLDGFMSKLGLAARELPTVRYPSSYSVEDVITGYEENKYSFTWDLDEATILSAADAVRRWAKGEFGEISRTIEDTNTIVWKAYDIP